MYPARFLFDIEQPVIFFISSGAGVQSRISRSGISLMAPFSIRMINLSPSLLINTGMTSWNNGRRTKWSFQPKYFIERSVRNWASLSVSSRLSGTGFVSLRFSLSIPGYLFTVVIAKSC
jgi:hypothetical protein